MQYMKASKLATGMLVAVLLLSSLAFLPSVAVKAAPSASGAMISFNVVDNTNTPVAGATATLTETHTSKKYTPTSDLSGLVQLTPAPGYYILRLSASGFYDLEYATIVKFDGINSVQLNLIQVNRLPTTTGTLSLTITPSVSSTLKTIDLSSPTRMEKTYTFTGTFSVALYTSNYRIIVSTTGYESYVADVTITTGATTTVTQTLNPAVQVNGFVYKNGNPGQNVTAVLVANSGPSLEKRIVQARVTSNYFVFDAYPGTFTLLVDAQDASASMQTVTVGTTPQTVPTVNLNTPVGQVDRSDVSFKSNDWNSFDLTRNIAMGYDITIGNIAYSNVPNIRMQIDFAFGNADGVVQPGEYAAFVSKVRAYGPVNVTSDFIVKVNNTRYLISTDFSLVAFSNLNNTATSNTAGYTGALKSTYASVAAIGNGANAYNALGYAKYDTPSLSYMVTLKWPTSPQYEMVSNSTQTTFIQVSGYTNVTLNPSVKTGAFEQVTMGIQKSVAPTAVGGAQVPSPYAYAVLGTNSTVKYFIVSTNRNISFTANGSADPNGNPLKYTWEFVGLTTIGPLSSSWTKYLLSAASFNITVRLTVTDVAALTAQTTFYIKADGLNPTADFTVRNKTVANGELHVNQNEALVFNGALSFDHIASTAPSDIGVIKTWSYVWGDKNTTTVGIGEQQNVTKTYARAGNFSMLLNVTDVAGHFSWKSVKVVVKDTTPPVVSFKVTKVGSTTEVVSAQENVTLAFSANATYDNNDSFDKLNFTWSMGDGTPALYGNYVEHFFAKTGVMTVKLTVVDVAKNKANITKTLTVTSSPRPDLRMVSMVFVPNVMTEGDAGTIRVNFTNVGNADANTPHIEFSILNSDGSKTPLGNGFDMTVNGTSTTVLKAGQYGIITFSWTPSAKGNTTIYANAVVDREIIKIDNSITAAVTVNEAGWKAIALYGGIFAVIIVVIVLFYMRKRLPKLGGRGKSEKVEPKGKK